MDDPQECRIEPFEKSLDPEALISSTTTHFFVLGMDCPLCARRVREGLLRQEGVLIAKVDLERKYATAIFDPLRTNPNLLIRAIEKAGNDGKHRYWAELYLKVPAEDILIHANYTVPA